VNEVCMESTLYLLVTKGSSKAGSRAVTSMPLLDRRKRAYENTSKLPQFTGHAQAVTLFAGKNSNEASVVCRQGS
jgi:hypothetical protein